jgi:SAM-dependent methyltransferase
MGANVICFDYSGAVDNALKLNAGRDNLLIVQADIAHLPIRQRAFDLVHCHRVLMHTPSPEASFRSIAQRVRPGGALFAHAYSRRPRNFFNYKYPLRPITKRMSHARLMRLVRAYGRPLHWLCGWTKRHRLGFLQRMIPFENYEHLGPRAGIRLPKETWFEFACLGVFDALTPTYDKPQSWRTMQRWFESEHMDHITVHRKKPVVITGRYAGPDEAYEASPDPAPATPARLAVTAGAAV